MDADRVHLIAVELAAEGSAECPPGTDVGAWRRDAQEAAQRLDRSVLTHRQPDGVAVAQLEDWPRDEKERAVHEAALRRAAIAAWTDPGATAAPGAAATASVAADPVIATPDEKILHPSQRSRPPHLRLVADA